LLTLDAGIPQAIPDDGYRLVITGTGIPASLSYITNRNSLGPVADNGTAPVQIVDVGLANDPIATDLAGKAALIERGGADYSVKISNAANAGAAFAIVFNNVEGTLGCPGGDALCPMGGTDFTTIPAVFIGNTQGNAIKQLLIEQTDTLARIQMSKAVVEFQVANTLMVEQVGARVQTDHPLRGDLRITLVSPAGTRSVLQRFNADTNAGPVDWTYYSTHYFSESSAGTWSLELSDHAEGAFGNLQEASLILHGPAITDTDSDGLDDGWETAHFTHLDGLPGDDPDADGYTNAREQIMHTDPTVAEIPFELAPATWNSDLVRLSWPGVEGATYELLSGTDVMNLNVVTTVAGTFPETSWFTNYTNLQQQFFLVRRLP
jgi:subtilisin-like proprotein convertase family protein